MSKPKKCWVVIHSHKYGTDAWPIFQSRQPGVKRIIKEIEREVGEKWDDEREYVDIRGPFIVS
jgi:hypothetical protein